MRPAFMFHNLGICLYGTTNKNVEQYKTWGRETFKSKYAIDFFEQFEYDSENVLKNLWKVSFQKRQKELTSRLDYSVCLALNIDHVWPSIYPPIKDLVVSDEGKLYFLKGGIDLPRGATRISPAAFYADSHIFDIACSFWLVKGTFPFDIKASTEDEEFYHYLKSLKIRTECVNYEDSSLFERST